MKKRLLALLLSVIMLITALPVSTFSAPEYVRDPDGDGEYFVLKASDETVSKDATTVHVDIDILDNTGIYAMKFYVIYDKELSLVSNDNVTPGTAFPDFVTSDVGSKDQTEEWMSTHDIDWDWMLNHGFLEYNENFYTGFDLGIEDFDDVRVTTVYTCCTEWDDYSTNVGTLCTFTFEIAPDNTKEDFTVRILPVYGNYIRTDPEHPLADNTGVFEFLDPIGLPGTVTVEGNEEPKATFSVSDAAITEGTETAEFTLSLANNPGIFGFSGYIGYNEKITLASFDIGTVFTEGEFPLGNPIDIGTCDRPASESKLVKKTFESYNASTNGVLVTTLYIEIDSLTENNTNNGVIASFRLNTADLPAGEYDILFYIQKNGLCNTDMETVEFKLVHGKLTVNECGHETVKGAVVEADCLKEGYTEYYCPTCDVTHKRDITPITDHNNTAVVTEPTCTEGGYTTYTCKVCGKVSVGDAKRATGHKYEDVISESATCTEDGILKRECTACGFEPPAITYPALGHDLKTKTVDDLTDDNYGMTLIYCTRCNYETFDNGDFDSSDSSGSTGNPPLSPPPSANPDGSGSEDSFDEDVAGSGPKPEYSTDSSGAATGDKKDPSTEGVPVKPESESKDEETQTEAKNEENTQSDKTDKNEDKSHQTGDGITVLVTVLLVSLAGAAIIIFRRKKIFTK